MWISFGTDGGRRVYRIGDWTLGYPDQWTVTCRPGAGTFLRRAVLAALAAALAAFLLMPVRQFNDPVLFPLRVLADALVVVAALHLASAFWQRIRIFRAGDALHVHTLLLLPRRTSVPLASLSGMNLLEQELRSTRKSGYRPLGWRWRVLLHAGHGGFEFWCGHSLQHSPDAPRRVAEFARHLSGLSGLPCPAPQTVEWRSGRRGAYPTGQRMTVETPPVGTRRVYHSLEELPPGMREEAEADLAEMRARGLGTLRRERVTVTDGHGNVHTYNSLDEMPPEVRRRFEEAMRRR